jgi:hypothetical protein
VDDIEIALVSFLLADSAVTELIQTKPSPARMFPDKVPQGQPRDKPTIVYEVLTQKEFFDLDGPGGLPNAVILLECRGASRKDAKLLRQRVLNSRGPDPDNKKLNGFKGSMGRGYVVQMSKVENSYSDYEPPIKDGEIGVHIAAVELVLWWNA